MPLHRTYRTALWLPRRGQVYYYAVAAMVQAGGGGGGSGGGVGAAPGLAGQRGGRRVGGRARRARRRRRGAARPGRAQRPAPRRGAGVHSAARGRPPHVRLLPASSSSCRGLIFDVIRRERTSSRALSEMRVSNEAHTQRSPISVGSMTMQCGGLVGVRAAKPVQFAAEGCR